MSLVAPDIAYRVPTPDTSSVNALVNRAWDDTAGQESTDAAIRSIFELRGAGRIPADTALVLIGQAVTDYLRAKLDGIITAYRQAKVHAYRGETRCEIVHQTETRSLGSLGFADYHARLKIDGTENPDNRIRPLAEIVLVTKLPQQVIGSRRVRNLVITVKQPGHKPRSITIGADDRVDLHVAVHDLGEDLRDAVLRYLDGCALRPAG
ncbi:MAG: hypothetical protein J0H82_10250 [Alphaproteobacteria bacterium]|jgi:hypothetical protein|nr:hypothetical protein [Alphaproteobacteria bacterium]